MEEDEFEDVEAAPQDEEEREKTDTVLVELSAFVAVWRAVDECEESLGEDAPEELMLLPHSIVEPLCFNLILVI